MKTTKNVRKWIVVLLVLVFIFESPAKQYANDRINEAKYKKEQKLKQVQEALEETPIINTEKEYALTYCFNLEEQAVDKKVHFQVKDLPLKLAIPERLGYNFAGWYSDKLFKNRIFVVDQNNVADYSLYAKWTANIDAAYNVKMYSYDMNKYTALNLKNLVECDYSFLEYLSIPGMPSTRETDLQENKITDPSICLQGMAFTDEFMLISGYNSNSNSTLGQIHVFDRNTGEYHLTLGMKSKSHLGGIAFDGKSIWVCHSSTLTLERIPYSFLKELVKKNTKEVVDVTSMFKEYKVMNTPSCITFYDNKIWVATYTNVFRSKMIAYEFTARGFVPVEEYDIPEKVQGVAFDDIGRVYFSTSLGRKNSSYLNVFSSLEELKANQIEPVRRIEMPPCSEEIEVVQGEIYILFESASLKYFEGTDGKGMTTAAIDKVLALSINSVLE